MRCKLHQALYKIANQKKQVPYNLKKLQIKIFPDQEIDLEEMLNTMEGDGLLRIEGQPPIIQLLDVFQSHSQVCGKAQQIAAPQLAEPWQPVQTKKKPRTNTEVCKRRNMVQKTGLAGFQVSPAFKTFMKAWPFLLGKANQEYEAHRAWERLERFQDLPDITIILQTLKTSALLPKTWPSTWLSKRPWRQTHTAVKCSMCHDEKIIYGLRENGSKGAIACPTCQNPNRQEIKSTSIPSPTRKK